MSIIKEKYIGESQLQNLPKKKLTLIIADKTITTPKIADEAITREKLEKSVQNAINVLHCIDCGPWIDGSTLEEPTYRYGAYLYEELNPETGLVETHDVWNYAAKWRCLQRQPVVHGNTITYFEPCWNSPYWLKIEGADYLMELISQKGSVFYRGAVDTVIYPYVYFANEDISDKIDEIYYDWERYTEEGQSEADRLWGTAHRGVKNLHLTNADMPINWDFSNKAFFECTVSIHEDNKVVNVKQVVNF